VRLALRNYLKRKEFSVYHLTQVRTTLEPAIVRVATSQITPEELQTLEDTIIYCENKLQRVPSTLPARVYTDIQKKDFEFHKLLAHATRNPVFALTMDYLTDFMSEFKRNVITTQTNHWVHVVNEHRDIFTSVQEGDADEAEAKMSSHMQRLKALLEQRHIEFLREQEMAESA
jgi:DNA-binding FadR family transcriptional regulator